MRSISRGGFSMLPRLVVVAAASLLGLALASAQTAPQGQNPLRPQGAPRATTQQTAPAPQQAQAAPTGEQRPKRQRSEAQLANDNRMRQCGAEWRANKAALQAQGKTWRVFNVECRARLKAQGR
jgi:hypothetical protein